MTHHYILPKGLRGCCHYGAIWEHVLGHVCSNAADLPDATFSVSCQWPNAPTQHDTKKNVVWTIGVPFFPGWCYFFSSFENPPKKKKKKNTPHHPTTTTFGKNPSQALLPRGPCMAHHQPPGNPSVHRRARAPRHSRLSAPGRACAPEQRERSLKS